MTPITDEQLWGTPRPAPKLPPGMTWRAGPDRVGHLLPGPGPVSRAHYLCGDAATPERLAWPALASCALCVARLEEGRA